MLLIIVLSILHMITSSIYYVAPDDHSSISNSTYTIVDYLSNASEYFTSNSQLHFLPGNHYLQSDLIIQNIINLTISGSTNSFIVCNSTAPVGLAIINVTQFTLQNISVINCGKNYSSQMIGTLSIHYYHIEIPPIQWNAGVFLFNCTFVLINNLLIITDANVNALLAINMMVKASITNLIVKVNSLLEKNNGLFTNGILIYYNNTSYKYNATVNIQNFSYQCNGSYLNTIQNTLAVILTQLTYSVNITVEDSSFHDFLNTNIFFYYGESCGTEIWSNVLFQNCQIYNNVGKEIDQMFALFFHNNGHMFGSIPNEDKCDRHYNIIQFDHCTFSNNSDLISLFYLVPINTLFTNAKLIISNCNFQQNYAFNIIKSRSRVQMLWQITHYIVIADTNITSNFLKNGSRIISITNGLLKFTGNVNIKNNSYFIDIVYLHLSTLQFNGSCVISSNIARHILAGREGSYYLLKPNSTVKVTNNTVVSVLMYSMVYNTHFGEICSFQFLNYGTNLDTRMERNETLYYSIEMINRYTAPIHLIKRLFYKNCSWLPDTAFQVANSDDVFDRILRINATQIDKREIRIIPASICKCNSTSEYDCFSHTLGRIYPGQTLTVNLIVPALISASKSSIQIIAEVVNKPQSCKIIDINELTQMKLDHGCNKYNYTVWSEKDECELYLSENQLVPEYFYVTLLPCPMGFVIRSDVRTCSCDSNLKLVVTSCNLDDGTVQRMANSWVSAETVNGLHTYDVSLNCPFDYCISHSSYLDLTDPDQQCRSKRSGMLCGHCPKGLSTVFGSTQCEKCSNMTLFIIIPIALAGILLVLMLFILNLTVTNGAINTFIFYFNIVSINISMFIPWCHNSFACITLSLFNLDLGIKTCFYDGMDDYAKAWLQLAFPLYLIFIALALIVGSRHSKMVQRLTARRGLAVLATLFLLSYTKVLLTVCYAIFFYSTVTHLPSEDSTVVWSVDTSIPLFGIRFSILFVTCLCIFLILIPFNILLLFTRSLSRFKFIGTFKPLLDAYFGPYKDKFYYWTGLQLLIRAVFFGLSAFDSVVNLSSGILLLGILLCVQGVIHPFKSWVKNVQESIVLLDLLALYVSALYNESKSKSKETLPVAWYLLFPVLVYFIIFVSCHCVMSMYGNTIKQKGQSIMSTLKSKLVSRKVSDKLNDMKEIRNKIPDIALNYTEFQEPLIALNN